VIDLDGTLLRPDLLTGIRGLLAFLRETRLRAAKASAVCANGQGKGQTLNMETGPRANQYLCSAYCPMIRSCIDLIQRRSSEGPQGGSWATGKRSHQILVDNGSGARWELNLFDAVFCDGRQS